MRHLVNLFILISLGVFLLWSTWKLATPQNITFSDAVKFADSAKSIINGQGRGIHHAFFNARVLEHFQPNQLFSAGFLPIISYTYVPFVYLLGANDMAITITTGTFYLLSLALIYFLGLRLFNSATGLMAALIFALHPQILDLATSGASEIIFTFLILVCFHCFISSAFKYQLLAIPVMILIFFTRHQAFIFIGGLLIYWLIRSFSGMKRYFLIICLFVSAYLGTQILHRLSNLNPEIWYSPLSSLGNIVYNSPLYPNNDALRSTIELADDTLLKNFIPLAGKVFYNLYHFVKNYWDLATPVFSTLFLIGLFIPLKTKSQNYFRILAVLLLLASYLAAAITIPNQRYILPVLPFLSLLSAFTIQFIFKNIQVSSLNRYLLYFLLFFISTSTTWGHIWIDYRFRQKNFNLKQPTINFVLSQKLSQEVGSGQLVITNLDAWASWYFGLTTMWFPLEPKQLITPSPNGPQLGHVSYIYLTEYKMNEGDFYMGESWREALYHPERLIKNDPIFSHFKVKKRFTVKADENYEKITVSGIIYERLD